MYKETLSKDLNKLVSIETAVRLTAKPMTAIGLAAIFLAIVWVAANAITAGAEHQVFIVPAGVIGLSPLGVIWPTRISAGPTSAPI